MLYSNKLLVFFLFLTSFTFGQQTYLDTFSNVSYSNNNGTNNFSSNWIEVRDDNAPNGGRIRITGGRLRFQNLDDRYIYRGAPLAGASSATFTMDYDATSRGDERLLVYIWNPGAGTFNLIANLNTSNTGSVSYNLTAAEIASNPRVLFYRGDTDWGGSERIFVDNVQFSATFGPVITVNNVTVNEAAGTATFTVAHTGANASGSFTVNYTTQDGTATAGSDYTLTTGTLNFNGTSGDTETITVPILNNPGFEADETFTVQFTSSSDGSVDISDTATGTITDPSDNPRPYEEREAINVQGNFKMRGNTNIECVSGCPATPDTNNPSAVMGYANYDGDASTANSSSSTITLPAGATVTYAGLYWGGLNRSSRSGITNPPGSLTMDQVKMRLPGSSTYNTVNATVRNRETTSQSAWETFLAYADVTTLVQTGGSGEYFVADIALATGSSFTGPFGGWTMVIIYEDATEKSRNISIWDGFDFFGFGANDTFIVTGLLTPTTGTFESHAGYFAFDGEGYATGDYVSINGTALSNGANPANNALNGTISEFGVDVGGRNPNYSYSWGMDIDVFDAAGLVPNSATSLNVELGSSSEGIWGGVFVTSNEIAFPAVASKVFTPSTVYEGDESTVAITVDNPSNGVSLTNFSLTDNLPTGMTLSTTPDASSSCGGTITATSGASSFSVSGVSLPAGSSCTFTFDVVTASDGTFANTISLSDISNDQNIPLQGESTGTLTVLPLSDSDNDGISDGTDLDDDNDGIPDDEELSTVISTAQNDCTGQTILDFSSAATLVSGIALQQGAVYRIPNVTTGTDALVTIVRTNNATVANLDNNGSDASAFRPQTAFNLASPGDRGYIEYNIQFVNSGGTTPVVITKFFANFNDIDGNNNYAEQLWSDNPTSYIISDPTELTMSTDGSWVIGTSGTNEFGGAGNGNPEVNFGTVYNSQSSLSVRVGAEARVSGANAGGRQHNIEFNCLTNYVSPKTYGIDIDSDGITNHLDLDSDNDGIYDAVEAGHMRPHTAGVVNGTYGANGLANIVETSAESGILDYSILDTDSTTSPDYLDTDSDDDGCSDANEAYADANADGGDNEYYTTGSPPATDGKGRVTAATYPVPADGDSDTLYDYRQDESAPGIDTQPIDAAACPGGNTSFTVAASNVDTYQWQLLSSGVWTDLANSGIHSGTTTAILTVTNAQVTDNGNQYRVIVSNSSYICSTETSNQVILTVAEPTVNAGTDQEICDGDSVTLTATALGGTAGYTYLWNTGQTTASITFTPTGDPNVNINIDYTVTVTDTNGCQDTDTVRVRIESAPTTTVNMTAASCGLDNGAITFSFPDHPNRTGIEFSLDNQASYESSVNDNSGSVTYNGLAAGTYHLWTRWGNDECPVDLGNVIVSDTPQVSINTQPANQTVFANDNATFSVVATNADTYQWQVSTNGGTSFSDIIDGTEYSGTQTATLMANTVEKSQSGYLYRVVVSNSTTSCTPVTSNAALLTVNIRTVITNRRITYRVKKN